jgi:hypothetical protein
MHGEKKYTQQYNRTHKIECKIYKNKKTNTKLTIKKQKTIN